MRYKPKVANRKAQPKQFAGWKFVVCFSAVTDVLLYAIKTDCLCIPPIFETKNIAYPLHRINAANLAVHLSVSTFRMLRAVAAFPHMSSGCVA
jgi:hypothetical protein